MAKKHHKSEKEKADQHRRTRANKLRAIEKALEKSTGKGKEQLLKRKDYWEAQNK